MTAPGTTNTERYSIYGGKVELSFNEAKHLYTVRIDGEEERMADGVTGILGVIEKGALVPWAAKLTAERFKELCLQETKPLNSLSLERICEEAKKAVRNKRDSAADIGRLAHSWIENWIKDGKQELPVNEQAKNTCNAFLQWWDENKVEPIKSEYKVYSIKHNYAGTVDFKAMVNGKRTLIDFKTSSGIYDNMFFQTSAYELADREESNEHFDQQMIVNIRKDGTLETRVSEEYSLNSEAFLAAMVLHRRIKKMKEKQ